MINASITLGIILSFVVSEAAGLLSGGLISPGYLALYMDQPVRVAATLAVGGLTYLLVTVLSNYVVLFGRRRFMANVLGGLLVGWIVSRAVMWMPQLGQDFRAVVHSARPHRQRQLQAGLLQDALSVVVVAGIVRLALILMF